MSPQYYAESRRTDADGRGGGRAINVGMYRDAAAAAAAPLPKPRTRLSFSSSPAISDFPPPLM